MQTLHERASQNTVEARRERVSVTAMQDIPPTRTTDRRNALPAKQEFAPPKRTPSDQTRQQQIPQKNERTRKKPAEAGVKTTVCFRTSTVPATTCASGCSVTVHSHEPVLAALSQSPAAFLGISARCASRATVKGDKSLLALQLPSAILFFLLFFLGLALGHVSVLSLELPLRKNGLNSTFSSGCIPMFSS